MERNYRDISIRNATVEDAEQLCKWWNDGSVMAHAGFPKGLGTTPEKVAEQIAGQNTKDTCMHMIVYRGDPIGEMNYHNVGNDVYEIGIKICEADRQNRGLGKIALSLFINGLFHELNCKKIILDTNLNNKRAQHVYEQLGFQQVRVNIDTWTDQLGNNQSSVDYELLEGNFVNYCTQRDKIVNGELEQFVDWFDTDGNVINASDGGIIYADGVYHWYGMALRPLPFAGNGKGGQTTTTGVVMYASKDLKQWRYEGVILPCSTREGDDLYGPMRFERPKIIYNDKTKKFVLWCHYVKHPGDHGFADGTADAGVAVCDTVNGTYKWLGYTRPIDEKGYVRDCTLYKDADGTAYFIYDRHVGADFRDGDRCLYIVKMSEDYLAFTDEYRRLDVAYWREAAAVVYHDGYYFMITSDLTSWDFNQAKYFRARNLFGPWEDMGDPCIGDVDHKTFYSQTTYIFKVEGKEALFIHMAERHNTQNFEHCSYIWLPIIFHQDHTLSLSYKKEWDI